MATFNFSTLKHHHTSKQLGYRSLSQGEEFIPYDGKYGKGFICLYPNRSKLLPSHSNRYYFIEYYIYY